jgi:hypothetical protein
LFSWCPFTPEMLGSSCKYFAALSCLLRTYEAGIDVSRRDSLTVLWEGTSESGHLLPALSCNCANRQMSVPGVYAGESHSGRPGNGVNIDVTSDIAMEHIRHSLSISTRYFAILRCIDVVRLDLPSRVSSKGTAGARMRCRALPGRQCCRTRTGRHAVRK